MEFVLACEPGWVKPSIVTPPLLLLMIGSALVGAILCTPPPGMANAMVAAPPAASASWIAAGNVHSPLTDVAHTPLRVTSGRSAVELTTIARPAFGRATAPAAAFGTKSVRTATIVAAPNAAENLPRIDVLIP